MGKMECVVLDYNKEGHGAIVTAVSDLEKLGYLIEGIHFRNGTLEITCFPPQKGKGSNATTLSTDGISESFKG